MIVKIISKADQKLFIHFCKACTGWLVKILKNKSMNNGWDWLAWKKKASAYQSSDPSLNQQATDEYFFRAMAEKYGQLQFI